MKSIIDESHGIFTCADELRQFVKPLYENSPICIFDYSKYSFTDNSFMGLGTEPALEQIAFNQQLYPTQQEFVVAGQNRYAILSPDFDLPAGAFDKTKYYLNIDLYRNHGIGHRFYIVNVTHTYAELFGFGLPLAYKGFQYLLNNIEMLEKFVTYFNEQSQPLIKKIFNDKLLLCKDFRTNELISHDLKEAGFNRKGFDKVLLAKTYQQEKYNLTIRELQILEDIASGLTAKEIASKLAISHRTIEVHIQNIKIKTNCHYKSELRKILTGFKPREKSLWSV